MLHTIIRGGDLHRSIDFYTKIDSGQQKIAA